MIDPHTLSSIFFPAHKAPLISAIEMDPPLSISKVLKAAYSLSLVIISLGLTQATKNSEKVISPDKSASI
jgi:hypothetical protein